MSQSRSSRSRYQDFVRAYKERRLDETSGTAEPAAEAQADAARRTKRRDYLRDYLRWLRPHRYRIALVFFFALLTAGLQMIEPLFMRFIIDRVLLDSALDATSRLSRLHLAGAV